MSYTQESNHARSKKKFLIVVPASLLLGVITTIGSTAIRVKHMIELKIDHAQIQHLPHLSHRNDWINIHLVNMGAKTIEITWVVHELEWIQFHVTRQGNPIETKPFIHRFSLMWDPPKLMTIKPNEEFQFLVAFYTLLPEKEQISGKYKVKASYKYKDIVYESKEIEIDVIAPG